MSFSRVVLSHTKAFFCTDNPFKKNFPRWNSNARKIWMMQDFFLVVNAIKMSQEKKQELRKCQRQRGRWVDLRVSWYCWTQTALSTSLKRPQQLLPGNCDSVILLFLIKKIVGRTPCSSFGGPGIPLVFCLAIGSSPPSPPPSQDNNNEEAKCLNTLVGWAENERRRRKQWQTRSGCEPQTNRFMRHALLNGHQGKSRPRHSRFATDLD